MTAPGVVVTSRANPPARGVSVDSGKWFVVGTAERGPVSQAREVRNMSEFAQIYGPRVNYSVLWDALDVFFREGGQRAWVARVSGPAAVAASVNLADASSGTSLRVTAASPGAWGNALSVAVVAGLNGGEFVLVVTHATLGEVDRSVSLADQAAAVTWSQNSDWIRVSVPGGASTLDPAVVSATPLTSGADDINGVDDTVRAAGLSLFDKGLGSGQVSVPGSISSTVRGALLSHARDNNRQAILDATDSGSRSSLVTEGKGLQGNEYGALFAPWVKVPGVVPGTKRTVPPCAAVAGLIARADGVNSPNTPAAGGNGQLRYALDLSQPRWTETDRDLLNQAGVNIFRVFPDSIRLYGYRTLANPAVDTSWLQLSNQRLRQVIADEAAQIGEGFVFDQIDGQGRKLAEYGGALAGMLHRHWVNGALYGATPEEAFSVDVGPSINTPTTIANGELRSVLTVKMSPFAERVVIEVVKVSSNESL